MRNDNLKFNLAIRHLHFGFCTLNFESKRGYAALTATLLTIIVSLTIISSLTFFTLKEVNVNRAFTKSVESHYISESGIEDALYRIIAGKQIGINETLGVGKGTTTILITTQGGNHTIRSEGKRDTFQQNLETTLETNIEGANFYYGVQVGYLGLEMENQSRIIGNVYSNGNIDGKNDAVITGDAWVARGTASSSDQTQSQQTDNLNVRDTTSRRDAAQSFIPSITAHINRISLYIKKVGNPGDIDIRVLPDNGGVPKNSGSLANGTLKEDNVTTNYGWVDVTLNSNDPILQNQKYWIVFDNGSDHTSKYYVFGGAVDSSYPSGAFLYSPSWNAASPIWTAPTQGARDATFKIFLGIPATYIKEMIVQGHAHANTLTDNKICGDAYYQSADTATLNFLNNPTTVWCPEPLTSGTAFPNQPDPQPQNMPISQAQIDEFKARADAGGTCVEPLCDALGNLERDGIGTTTLNTPLKITGNVRLENKAGLILSGNLHIVGNFTLKNTCRIELSPAYGSLSGIIVVDGETDIENKCALVGSGDPASHIMVLTTNPKLDGNGALHLKNSTAGAIFYASEGMMFLENQTDLKEAIAQKLKMKNQATVTYETGLTSVNFSSGPSGGYDLKYWKKIE